eukprot:9086834-Karenia_brevis.AAC.1
MIGFTWSGVLSSGRVMHGQRSRATLALLAPLRFRLLSDMLFLRLTLTVALRLTLTVKPRASR